MTSTSDDPEGSPRPGPAHVLLWGPPVGAAAVGALAPGLAFCAMFALGWILFGGTTGALAGSWLLAVVALLVPALALWGLVRLLRLMGATFPWTLALVALAPGIVLGLLYAPERTVYTDWTLVPVVLWGYLVVWLGLARPFGTRRSGASTAMTDRNP
ncbi:hypothetical protein ACFW4K_06300 [Nocardiopsis alba]|uniref:hypothetical protein n=1 Tax=Nocardiopsis alba TaxID=53437 RepID=UPI00366C184D